MVEMATSIQIIKDSKLSMTLLSYVFCSRKFSVLQSVVDIDTILLVSEHGAAPTVVDVHMTRCRVV